MSIEVFYELTLELIFKGVFTPTPVNSGKVVDGDLNPFRVRLELVNTGNKKTDHGVLTIVIPPDGTFVRTAPILVDEGAKDNYIIQAQIKQHDGAGGVNIGKAFRFTVAQPTIQDDPDRGEILKLQLIPMEYRLKEILDAEQLKFLTPAEAFVARLSNYADTKGALGTTVGFQSIDNGLPTSETLRQNWEPFAPKTTHELLYEIVDSQSQVNIAGGTFTDYFFDVEADTSVEGDLRTGVTSKVNFVTGNMGGVDSGVVIDPLTFNIADTEKDKTINSDLQSWKNIIILECAQDAGRLPMEEARFSSNWAHAQTRPDWDTGLTYYADDDPSGNPQSFVKVIIPFNSVTGKKSIDRYFKCDSTHTSSSGNKPDGSSGDTVWFEDFTIIPDWSEDAHYELGELVSEAVGGDTKFFISQTQIIALHGLTLNSPSGDPTRWLEILEPFWTTRRNAFFSYTPWTSDYNLQLSNVSATASGHRPTVDTWSAIKIYQIGDEVQLAGNWYRSTDPNLNLNNNPTDIIGKLSWGFLDVTNLFQPYPMQLPIPTWVGVIPDWNMERALYDRIEATDQFENVTFKVVKRRETNSNNISSDEKLNGQRFLIQGTGTGLFSGRNNQIAEWFDPPSSPATGIWKFSKSSSDFNSDEEMCLDLEQGQILQWNGVSWVGIWTANNLDNGQTATVLHAMGVDDGTDTAFGLVTGATGIPAQAIRLKFSWDPIFESRMNLSSRGAWWVQHLPMPFTTGNGRIEGDVFGKSTLDTTNLDTNRFGNKGWNNGLDSEDMGRISTLKMKVRLTVKNSDGALINEIANMPFKSWAIDVFGRVWYSDFSIKRNGEYSTVEVAFGDRAPKKLHHNRIDELFTFYGFTFSQNFFLKEKEFTGIEFDWRFVKSFGIFWAVGYDDNGMYVASRDAWIDIITAWGHQIANYGLRAVFGPIVPATEFVVDRVFLDIDELSFKKTLYANSDAVGVIDARTELENFSQERDYLNAKVRAQGIKARKKFVNQTWDMQAQGDVRLKFGQAFKASGSRVPEQTANYLTWSGVTSYAVASKVEIGGFVWQSIQSSNLNNNPLTSPRHWVNMNQLVCSQVKHVIDGDGYTMQILGTRKFVYGE